MPSRCKRRSAVNVPLHAVSFTAERRLQRAAFTTERSGVYSGTAFTAARRLQWNGAYNGTELATERRLQRNSVYSGTAFAAERRLQRNG
eukprot:9122178-Alexandrium_andersonii.AAC.1